MAAVCIYLFALKVPIYGLNYDQLVIASQSIGALSRVSVGALGLVPLLSALRISEVARLVGLRASRPGGEDHAVASWVIWLSLFFAVLQGAGISTALEQIPGENALVPEPGATFRIVCVASMVATTAIFWWLADMITRYGVGSGFWVLLLVLFVMGFATSDVPLAVEAVQTGQTSALVVAAVLAGMGAIVFTIVFLVTQVAGIARTDAVVWPSLLVPVAINLILLPFGALAALRGMSFPQWLLALVTPSQPIGLAVTAGLIYVVTYLAGRLRDDQMTPAQIRIVAVGLIAIMLLGNALQATLALSLTNGTMLIVATAVALHIILRLRTAV